ncbi:MAG: hypothetical protein R6X22_07180 [Gemmatimonadota bacterium]
MREALGRVEGQQAETLEASPPLAVTAVFLVRRLFMEDVLGQEISPLGT